MKNFVSKIHNVPWLAPGGIIILCIQSFGIRFYSLGQTPFANGWDAYFYLENLTSILEEGKMHSEEWTLLYPLLVIFHYLSPDDITAVKLLSACLSACFTLLMMLNAHALNLEKLKEISQKPEAIPIAIGSQKLAVIFIGVLTLWSPELTYFTAQWPKNLLGLNLLLLLLLCIQYDKRGWIIFLLVVGFFGHRMTAMLSIILAVVWFAMLHLTRKVIIVGLLMVVMIALAGWVFKGILSIHDIDRLHQFITFDAQLPITSFLTIFGRDKISFLWKCELILVLVSFLALGAFMIHQFVKGKKVNSMTVLVVILFIILWFPFYHWDLTGVGYRFFHVGALLLPLMVMILLHSIRIPVPALIVIVTAFFLTSFFAWRVYMPERHDPPYAFYERLTGKTIASWKDNEKPALVIAHKALAEYFSYTSEVDAMSWIPEYAIAPDKLWRMAVLPYPKLFEFYVGYKPLALGGNYFFVREDDWNAFLQKIKENESPDLYLEHTDWKNPSEMRPKFLKK